MKKLALITIATSLALAGTAGATNLLRQGTVSYTQRFGSGDWEAGYTANGHVRYDQDATTTVSGDKLTILGSVTAWVEMMGRRNDVAQVRGEAYTTIGGSRAFEVEVWARVPAIGIQMPLYSNSFTGTISVSKSYSPMLMATSAWFWAGPIPIKATAYAEGSLSFSASGTLGASSINLSFAPKAGVDAGASAEVDMLFASAGVYGELNLLYARLPFTASIGLASGCYGATWQADVDLRLQSLGGEFGIFGTLAGKRYEHAFWGFDPVYDNTYPLFNNAGTTCF